MIWTAAIIENTATSSRKHRFCSSKRVIFQSRRSQPCPILDSSGHRPPLQLVFATVEALYEGPRFLFAQSLESEARDYTKR